MRWIDRELRLILQVDFQLCVYTSPAIDLLYFLSTSPSVETIENNKDVLLNEYHNTLTSIMKQVGCKTQPPTMEKLKASLKERAIYGMIASFTVLPLVVCHHDEVKDFDEMMSQDGGYENPGYKGKLYRQIIAKRIPMYDELGLLDCWCVPVTRKKKQWWEEHLHICDKWKKTLPITLIHLYRW